jgi:hypothetical protein
MKLLEICVILETQTSNFFHNKHFAAFLCPNYLFWLEAKSRFFLALKKKYTDNHCVQEGKYIDK